MVFRAKLGAQIAQTAIQVGNLRIVQLGDVDTELPGKCQREVQKIDGIEIKLIAEINPWFELDPGAFGGNLGKHLAYSGFDPVF